MRIGKLAGVGGAIYVDDSGNPGVDSGSDYLPSSRKSWTAVIVPTIVAKNVQSVMQIFLDGIRQDFGAEELHFTEIWSGIGPWENVSPAKRAEMIDMMARVISSFDLPIVHQTVSEQTLSDHPDFRRSLDGVRISDWKLDDISQFGLLLLCSGVSRHVRQMKSRGPSEFDLPFPLYIDEGMLPAGSSRKLPNWEDVIKGPEACFHRSVDVPGIQLADFAAFVITRTQWAAVKRTPGLELKPAEQIIFRAAAGLNILNLPMSSISPAELGRENYEERMAADREAKGLPRRPITPAGNS